MGAGTTRARVAWVGPDGAPRAQESARREERKVASTEDVVRAQRSSLQDSARAHLWMHFTRMGAYAEQEIPIIVRGEGCYVYDEHGKRYLDGLSALYCVNIGHGRAELGKAAAKQAEGVG